MVKIGKKKVKNGEQQSVRLTPIEDASDLVSMLKFGFFGANIGGYLLQKGQNAFKIIFGFECQGVHPTLRSEEIDPVFDALEVGLKDIPPRETLTVNLGSFTDDTDRQNELKQLFDGVLSNELRYLVMAERARVRQLNDKGIRKPKYLRLYCSYTVDPESFGAADPIEKMLLKSEKSWKKFTGEYDEMRFFHIEQILRSAYTDGYQLWQQLLSNKMGLIVRPYSETELWEQLWCRFNSTVPRQIPQLVVLDEAGLREEVYSEWHPVTVLMESPQSVPVADRQWVHSNGKYIGVLTFLEKPGGWLNKSRQMRYLWGSIARDAVYDTEIVCQLSRANDNLIKTNMQRIAKQSIAATELSAEKQSVDVKAMLNIKKSVASLESIYEGEVPIYVGLAFLIYRDTRNQLDDACRYFQSLFVSPAWVLRETEYPWKVWWQCLPIVWDRLLAVPFNRRQLYLSGEAPGLIPFVRTKDADKTGFELIGEEAGTPIHIDLYKAHRNLGLFGTTRSGKSVLASGIITHALAMEMPVVILDYPKPDGTSTFSDYTRFLSKEGAYFDIGSEANNLFELPNLKGLPDKMQKERMDDYLDFLLTALQGMVLGTRAGQTENTVLVDTIRSVLGLALQAFFGDVQIRDRYAEAFKYGLGSPEWQTMPTLSDFIGYCSQERLRLDAVPGDTKTAIERIKLRLRFWETSRVGKAIAQPSTFRTDAQLLVFALRNLSNDEDAAIIAQSAYSAALRKALSAPASIFFIDESPILFEFAAISNLIGRLCANGAKSGIRVILSAQDPDTIAKSPAAAKVFQNINTRLVGRIQPSAVDSFVNILKYPREIVGKNATEAFFPKREGIYSKWLLDDNGSYTECRYYPSIQLLAVVANNPYEQQARNEVMKQYPDKFIALTQFSRQLVQSR